MILSLINVWSVFCVCVSVHERRLQSQ